MRDLQEWRCAAAAVITCMLVGGGTAPSGAAAANGREQLRFEDRFETGLSRWDTSADPYVRVEASGDAAHGDVLVLTPGGDVFAFVKGSENWGRVRIEADVLFPTDEDNYLAVLYNAARDGRDGDFGGIYVKGNDSYLQANPHRDWNVSRTYYPEYRQPLRGEAAIATGRWQRIRVEVDGAMCHFYVGDMAVPQMTFGLFEARAGRVGFQPRSVGGPVWVDNVRITSIDRLSYGGAPRPAAFDYAPQSLQTEWQVAGPFDRSRDDVARNPGKTTAWRPFAVDARGAVITGSVTDYHGPRTVAYFRTQVRSEATRTATLHLSTVDDLAMWVNGRFHWFVPRGNAAWFDFWRNPAHAGQKIPIDLTSGMNDIVLRVRGGVYTSGAFYARVE